MASSACSSKGDDFDMVDCRRRCSALAMDVVRPVLKRPVVSMAASLSSSVSASPSSANGDAADMVFCSRRCCAWAPMARSAGLALVCRLACAASTLAAH